MALIGMGWLTCIPFDTDVLTGEPIVQCNSISDQTPCPAGVVEYPGQGYCPSTVNGYVPELFMSLPGVAGLGRPYWEFDGGYMPIERIARDNHAPRPSEEMIQRVQAQRMAEITRGAIQNYSGGALREDAPASAPVHYDAPAPMAVQVVRTRSGRPGPPPISQAVRNYRAGRGVHGMGDAASGDSCPTGFRLDPNGAAVCLPNNSPAFSSGSSTVAQISAALQAANAALQPGQCPTGFVLHSSGAVCIPANSPAAIAQAQQNMPGAQNWTKYAMIGGAVLLGVVVLAMVVKR